MKKGTAVFLALLLTMFCLPALAEAPVASDEASAAQTVRGQSYPFLFQGSDESGDPVKSEMKLYFVDGGDIPYAALSEFLPVLSNVLAENGSEGIVYEMTAGRNGDLRQFTVTRPDNGRMMFVYPDTDVLMFNNFNTFRLAVGAKQLVKTG